MEWRKLSTRSYAKAGDPQGEKEVGDAAGPDAAASDTRGESAW